MGVPQQHADDLIGHIQVRDVMFDPTKRKELDASILDSLVSDYERALC
jgi:hypothetical protein